jgi:hypothetical protein
MGTKYLFKCPSCNYQATVSGGKDRGMFITVRTMICNACIEVVDVIIGAHRQEGRIDDSGLLKLLGRCPLCKGSDVVKWRESQPCPKCSNNMLNKRFVCDWD